jgi:N-acyl-D-amino-acid deacylase
MSEDNVREQMGLPLVSFGSDEEAPSIRPPFTLSNHHPRAFGNFARVLGKYARDEEALSLPQAIRRLAALPAENLKLRRRGTLKPGNYADVVVFDALTIADHATYEDPHQYATGMRQVFVNGTQVLKDGEPTGQMSGRVVRGPGWTGWGN